MAYTTIKKPSDYFNTKLYTGNGSTQSITGVGFKPDATFFKQRTGSPSSSGSQFYDAVRGATKYLSTHSDNAEATQSNGLTSFDSDGFSIGSTSRINGNTESYVTWNWLANGVGSTNYDGSINSTVSANTTSGFSIVSWTGTGANATVGHGLGSAPSMIILKNRETTGENWLCYHKNLGGTKYVKLNETSAEGTSSSIWNDTDPTNSVFSIGANSASNGSGLDMIAYCFAEKTGYSKFGSYVSNGVSGNGSFTYLGFKPSFVIHKRTDSAGDWRSWNNKADAFNQNNKSIFPNTNSTEYDTTNVGVDFLSNGIKWRQTDTTNNNPSGGTFIYMAFAEAPLVGSNNVPCTAR